jgi:acyl-CoA thioester hydrolase
MSTPRRHSVSLRVRFSETDAMGVANNGVYLAWLEIARIEYLRALGHSYRDVHDGGLDLVVAEANVRYLKPLQFDDEFEIDCGCAALTRATVTFDYELVSPAGVHARATTRHACVDRASMRPVRLPEWLRAVVTASS